MKEVSSPPHRKVKVPARVGRKLKVENPAVCCPVEDFCSSGAVASRAFQGRGKDTAINAHCMTGTKSW
ncbi:hypothetical protein Y032_0005g2316 [Ancylostoma ceylanicum]|nr:hypothetical protein Y032_0005g2316 [Ancylostoma ceylanicum]